MDAVEFFREYARMFKTLRKGVTITNMYITVEGVLPPSQEVSFECSTTKDEIDKVINWSKNHPRKNKVAGFQGKIPEWIQLLQKRILTKAIYRLSLQHKSRKVQILPRVW